MARFNNRKWRRLSRSLGPAVIAVAAFALGSSLNKRTPEPAAPPVIPARASAVPSLGLPTVANLALPAPPPHWGKEEKRAWWVAKNQETRRQRQALATQLQVQRAAAADAAWRSSRPTTAAPAFPINPAPRRNAFAMNPELQQILRERQQSAPVPSPGAAYAARSRPAYAQSEQVFPQQPLVTSSPQTFQSETPRDPQTEVSEIPAYPTDDPYRQFYRQKPSVSEQLRANGRIDGKPLAADRNASDLNGLGGFGGNYGSPGFSGLGGSSYSAYSGYGSGYSGSSKSKRGWDGVPKSVHVRSYTRRDGTFVRSHSRRPPRR